MKIRLPIVCIFLSLSYGLDGRAPQDDFPVLKGPYLGQKPPGMTAEIFASGVVSLEGRYEFGLGFSPEGDELLFTGAIPEEPSLVYHSRIVDGRWTKPKLVNLSGGAKKEEMEAFYSRDGRTVFFAPYDEGKDVRIWKVGRGEDGWHDPAPLTGRIADESAFYPTCSDKGTLYYSNIARRKIYKATLEDGVVTESGEAGLDFGGHGFIAPDESFILVDATRDDGCGKQDIYVAFRNRDGSWSRPMNLGTEVNTEYSETCPSLSADGKYLFFSRYNEPGELSNFYWIDSRVIEEARRAFKHPSFAGDPLTGGNSRAERARLHQRRYWP
jgi:Tol biopolymer transport system component